MVIPVHVEVMEGGTKVTLTYWLPEGQKHNLIEFLAAKQEGRA